MASDGVDFASPNCVLIRQATRPVTLAWGRMGAAMLDDLWEHLFDQGGVSVERQATKRRHGRGHTYEFAINGLDGRVTITTTADHTVRTVVLAAGKQGSTISGLCDALSQMTSLALAHHTPVQAVAAVLTGLRFEPAGATGDPEIPTATSVADYLGRRIAADLVTRRQRARRWTRCRARTS
ncbi:hypothetical protein GCM10009682_24020 [Luedemannella flava]|uniref:ribonucleoside-diphosphate reductase n=1 Tax=Luedemannella flava TaxID=349316 RepID=A0ABN2LX84_9ACTN